MADVIDDLENKIVLDRLVDMYDNEGEVKAEKFFERILREGVHKIFLEIKN